MANRTIYEIIAKAIGFGKTNKSVKTLSGSMKRLAAGLVTTAAAYKGFGAAVDSVKLAGKIEGVERAFNNMRIQAGFSVNTFSKLDQALNGTADRLTVMEQANNAMLLGIVESDDQMAEMFDTAQRLAQAVGKDATFGIESLVTGLGRQSKLMLDNLGIMVDVDKANREYAEALGKTASQLTEAERKQAFINKALSEGKRLVELTGEETITASQKFDQFSTSMTNFKETVGVALVESGVIDSLTNFMTKTVEAVTALAGLENAEKNQSEAMKDMNEKIGNYQNSLSDLETTLFDLDVVYGNIASSEEEFGKSHDRTLQLQIDLEKQGLSLLDIRQMLIDQMEHESEFLNILMQDKQQLETIEAENANLAADRAARLRQDEEDRIESEKQTESFLEQMDAAADKRESKRQKKVSNRIKDEKAEKAAILSTLDSMKIITDQLGIDNKAIEQVTIAHAIADTLAGANKALKQGGVLGFAGAAAVVAAGMQNVQQIKASYGAQYGFEGVVNEPTQFTVGEGGASEFVSVTPLEGVDNAGTGQGMTVNITGNVMSDEFVEEELAERIADAVRRGVDFGMS
tara:strand:+ start:3326 stop:5050 length:1725 start_codon:yes stop_codon:yes gene_type:complete